MSVPTIAPYFPFRRIKIVDQTVSEDACEAQIRIQPDKRFQPICHCCGHRGLRGAQLDRAQGPGFELGRHAGLDQMSLSQSVLFALSTCQHFRAVSPLSAGNHLPVVPADVTQDWKTVKAIDKYTDLHTNVLFVGKHRKAKTLKRFFNQLKPRQRKSIDAVVMDMWDPFIKAVKKKLPNAKIVFDLFHVVANFNRVIDKVRNSEYRKASKEDKAVYKGAKYLLLKNRSNLRRLSERQQLQHLLELNEVINTVLILKEKLKHIWTYRSRTWAGKALDQWCELAGSLKNQSLTAFVKTLQRYRYGILNHYDYTIHNGKLDGVNNKIKFIKRKAYGFHDLRYFTLKIYQAFSH